MDEKVIIEIKVVLQAIKRKIDAVLGRTYGRSHLLSLERLIILTPAFAFVNHYYISGALFF